MICKVIVGSCDQLMKQDQERRIAKDAARQVDEFSHYSTGQGTTSRQRLAHRGRARSRPSAEADVHNRRVAGASSSQLAPFFASFFRQQQRLLFFSKRKISVVAHFEQSIIARHFQITDARGWRGAARSRGQRLPNSSETSARSWSFPPTAAAFCLRGLDA